MGQFRAESLQFLLDYPLRASRSVGREVSDSRCLQWHRIFPCFYSGDCSHRPRRSPQAYAFRGYRTVHHHDVASDSGQHQQFSISSRQCGPPVCVQLLLRHRLVGYDVVVCKSFSFCWIQEEAELTRVVLACSPQRSSVCRFVHLRTPSARRPIGCSTSWW